MVVLISIISGVLIISQKNKEESIYSEDVYSYVDDIIKDNINSDNYLNADINEKYKIINKILNSLEKENKILSNSIEYDSANKIFWYNYSDGTEGGIMLENFSEGYSGNAKIDNYVERKDEQGRILSYNCDIDFNSNEYPYTEKELESLNLKAKFMYGLGYNSILDEYKKYQTNWTKQYLKTDIDDYCTVEDFKSGLSGYNIIFIEEHGYYSNKKIMICTEELTSKKSDSNYKADLKHKRINKVVSAKDNKQYYWINPSFFSFYYKNNELSNTIIWIGSCHGYQCDDLVNAFSRCGAKAVIGYDESVLTSYDCVMLNPFIYSLLYGDSVSEALNFAKSIYGQNDLECWRTYRGTTSKFGTIALMPSDKNNCATAQLYPGKENARLIDDKIIGAQRGGKIKSKAQSPEMVEIEEIENYEWHLEPTIEAEDIIVSDDSFDVKKIDSDKKKSNTYSFIERDGKYNFITYDGDIVLKKWYLEPRIAEYGELGVYIESSVNKENDLGVNINFNTEEYDGGWGSDRRGMAEAVYYVYPYDKKTSKIYHDMAIGTFPHWGYECSNNCDNNSAILIQESDVIDNQNYGNNVDYNGKYGSAYNNEVTISPIYDNGIMNVYNDIIAFKSGEKWGYFNGRTGKQVIDFIANEFESKYYSQSQRGSNIYRESRPYTYSDGYVAIKSDKGWTLYDDEGNIVINCGIFEEVRPVHNGLAWVKKDGKWGVIKLKDIEVTTSSPELKEIKSDNKMGEVKIEDGYLNIRDKPSTKGKIIGKLYNSDRVTIEESSADGKWLKIMKEDIKGYASKDYIKILEDIEQGTEQVELTINGNYSWTREQVINSVNAYLKENWCGENQYYCFESELKENEGYWWVCIRWDGSNSANVITGNDCKINKETGAVEISFDGKPYEWFNLKDYQ